MLFRPGVDVRRDYPSLSIARKDDEQLASYPHDGDAPRGPGHCADPLAEPFSKRAAGLISQLQPRELNEGFLCAWIRGPTDASIAIKAAAPIQHRCKAEIAGQLLSVGKRTIQHLPSWHGGEFSPMPRMREKARGPSWRDVRGD